LDEGERIRSILAQHSGLEPATEVPRENVAGKLEESYECVLNNTADLMEEVELTAKELVAKLRREMAEMGDTVLSVLTEAEIRGKVTSKGRMST
jgi:hypothetical protein